MTENENADAHSATLSDSRQFLTFTLQGEEYGIDILKVQEIKGFSKITPIPSAPHYIKGVLNLRGTVVPVVELRSRFGLPEKELDQFTVIIVVKVNQRVLGMIVDAVSDVLNIPEDQIEDPPRISSSLDSSYVIGMGKVSERIIMLLDIPATIGVQDLDEIEVAA